MSRISRIFLLGLVDIEIVSLEEFLNIFVTEKQGIFFRIVYDSVFGYLVFVLLVILLNALNRFMVLRLECMAT